MVQRLLNRSWAAESGFFWARRRGSRVNVNYLLIEGLQRSGYDDLAIQAARDQSQ